MDGLRRTCRRWLSIQEAFWRPITVTLVASAHDVMRMSPAQVVATGSECTSLISCIGRTSLIKLGGLSFSQARGRASPNISQALSGCWGVGNSGLTFKKRRSPTGLDWRSCPKDLTNTNSASKHRSCLRRTLHLAMKTNRWSRSPHAMELVC